MLHSTVARVVLLLGLVVAPAALSASDPHENIFVTANGIEHVFTHQVIQGAGDREGAVDAVKFIYSQCWSAQFLALGGTAFTPSHFDSVITVIDNGKVFRAVVGQGNDAYHLEKTDRGRDGCGFRILGFGQSNQGVRPL